MRRRKSINQYVEHLIFKAVGLTLTAAMFILVYYLLLFPTDLGLNSVVGVVFPGVMVLIWESLKGRKFWWFWLAGSILCAAGMCMIDGMDNIMRHTYWLISFSVCAALAVVPSRAAFYFREREKENADFIPTTPQKDEFIEQHFSKK